MHQQTPITKAMTKRFPLIAGTQAPHVNAKNNDYFRIVAAMGVSEPVKVYLYGDIAWYDIDAAAMLEALAPHAGRDIELHILSDGGDVFYGQAIYAALKDHNGKITGIIDSVCASISSFIAMACDELLIRPFAQIMIHECRGGNPWATVDEKLAEIEMMRGINDAMAEAFAAKSGKAVDDVKADMKSDFWLKGQSAVDYGLCDGLYGDDMDAASASEFIASSDGFRPLTNLETLNAPKELIALFGESKTPNKPTPTAKKPESNPMTEPERLKAIADYKAEQKTRRDAIGAAFRPHLKKQGVNALLNKCMDDEDCDITSANLQLTAVLDAVKTDEDTPTPTEGGDAKVKAAQQARKYLAQIIHTKMLAKVDVEKENPYQWTDSVTALRMAMKDAGHGEVIAGMHPRKLVAMAFDNSMTDFSDIFEEGIKLIVQEHAADNPEWYLPFVRKVPMDFGRANNLLKSKDKESLKLRTENGEFIKAKLEASKESVWLDSYGLEITISRELFQSDNLGYINGEIADFMRIANMLPQELLLGILQENTTLEDDEPIFAPKFKNLFDGALDAAKLAEMRGAFIDTQTNADSKTKKKRSLGLRPEAILTSGAEESRVKALMSAPMIDNKPNVAYEAFANTLADGMLAGTGKAFSFAKGMSPGIIQGYNKDDDGVQVEQKQEWRSDGMVVRIWLDIAMQVVNRRMFQCHQTAAA
ncbi:Clp protease ClpP [Vibrio aestuarianus]|uniref:Clp protease ClpP n=1 Tax=Vibrio aestuarianus TaxID=28171 RepID=UPI001594A8E1|nr:Clp protease ClpP [Vibrio aestuarianus]NGZ17982.1 Clp protease ClpP [Vibrio aestuarianus]